jgi:serine/threonine-protein kinase RsbT
MRAASSITPIATAISEVARNIIEYAGTGQMALTVLDDRGAQGMQIVARDNGPGIADVELALRDGYSSAGSLGLGLPGARRLMDELEVSAPLGRGTTITMRKWVP